MTARLTRELVEALALAATSPQRIGEGLIRQAQGGEDAKTVDVELIREVLEFGTGRRR